MNTSQTRSQEITEAKGPWFWMPVKRADGGGLYAPVNAEGIESGHTPSHDRETVRRLCDELNACNFVRVIP